LLEKERDQLNVHVGELEVMQESLEKQASTYQGQLAAEQTKTKALENNKREVSDETCSIKSGSPCVCNGAAIEM
jgi:hypothetical protein